MVFCSKCGNESPDGTTFCSRCGTRLNLQGSNGVASPGGMSPPSPPGTYPPAPANYQGPAGPKRDSFPIIIVVLIVGCLIVAALALVLVQQPDADSLNDGTTDASTTIHNGDYADYKLTIKNGTQSYVGTYRVIYTNVTATSITMTTTMTINGHTNTTTKTIDLSGEASTGESLADSGSGDSSGATSTTAIGNETISTALGFKECTHTRTVTPVCVEDDWYDQYNLYKITLTYTDGSQMILEMTGTNMASG